MAQSEMSPIPSGPRRELGARHISVDDIDLPPLPPIPERLPLGLETERAWMDCFEQINASIARLLSGTAPRYHQRDLKPVAAEDVRRGFTMLQGGMETRTVFLGLAYFWHGEGIPAKLERLLVAP